MLLVFDIGNTNITIGAYRGSQLLDNFRLGTNALTTSDEYGMMVEGLLKLGGHSLEKVEDVIISSVVPEVMHSIENFSRKYCHREPMIVGPGVKTGMNIKYDNPQQVGADRIVNAVAGLEKYGAPLILIDFGTATTFCVLNEKGEYLGGAIAPGIKISTEALFQRASKLHRVEIIKPKNVIGKNTTGSMQSGIVYGYAGLVDKIVHLMKKELGRDNVQVVATGGLASLIAEESEEIQIVDKLLTLEGLRLIYEKNTSGDKR